MKTDNLNIDNIKKAKPDLFMKTMMTHTWRVQLIEVANMSRCSASNLIDDILHYVEEKNLGEELLDSWHQLSKWVGFLNDSLCEDCEKELKLTTAQEAKELLDSLYTKPYDNAEILTNISVLRDSFNYWGT